MECGNHRQLPDVDDLPCYIENRARRLRKAYDDYALWEEQLRIAKHDVTGFRWTDMDGNQRVVMITDAYLKCHWRLIRALILDLADCGPHGKQALREIMMERTGNEHT